MDRRERYSDPEEMLRVSLEGMQGKLWTALPGIIDSFDAAAHTCKVQPAISGKRRKPNGDIEAIQLPLLLDCPVVFPGGGGCTLTFPIKPGDECLVVFASRCIDSWWQLGGVQGQAEFRMHDLSDGFVIPGGRSQPRKFDVSESAAQLRSDDGQAFVEINPESHNVKTQTVANIDAIAGGNIAADAGGNISANADGNISAQAGGTMTAQSGGAMSLTAPTITLNGAVQINGPLSQGGGNATTTGNLSITGNVTASGTITGTTDVVGGGKSLKTHVHSGVTAGGANTGAPV